VALTHMPDIAKSGEAGAEVPAAKGDDKQPSTGIMTH